MLISHPDEHVHGLKLMGMVYLSHLFQWESQNPKIEVRWYHIMPFVGGNSLTQALNSRLTQDRYHQ